MDCRLPTSNSAQLPIWEVGSNMKIFIFLSMILFSSISFAVNCLKDPDLCTNTTTITTCSGKLYSVAVSVTTNRHGYRIRYDKSVFDHKNQAFVPVQGFEISAGVLFYKEKPVEKVSCQVRHE